MFFACSGILNELSCTDLISIMVPKNISENLLNHDTTGANGRAVAEAINITATS